jgi:hypothetical protein
MFGPRYGYGYAGAAFARLLSFLCPMLLLLEALAVVVRLPSTAVRSLWILISPDLQPPVAGFASPVAEDAAT